MNVPKPKKQKSGKYRIQLRLGGKSYPIISDNAKACEREARAIKAAYKAGKLKPPEPEKPTISAYDAIDQYLADKSNVLSPSTIRSYKGDQKRFVSFMCVPADTVNWQEAINLEARIVAPKTVKNAWSTVRTACRYCGIDLPDVTLPAIPQAVKEWLEPEEILRLVQSVKGQTGELECLIALHGLRRSELLGLTWDRVDISKGLIYIRGATVFDGDNKIVDKDTNKNRTSARTIPIMIPELSEALKAIPEANRNGKIITCHPNTVYRRINTACRKAGLPEVGCHGLRHSFASLSYHVGNSELETMRLGGWSNPATMRKIYTHLAASDRERSENRITAFFDKSY